MPTRREFLEASTAALVGAAAPARSIQSPPLPVLTIAEAAWRLSTKQLSPVELTHAVLARIEALNPSVGAFITTTAAQAVDAARTAERDIQRGAYRGPLHGIPFAVKDTYYTKGIATTAGSPVLQDFVPDFDSTVVERLTHSGGILIGKLNLPEFSFGGYTPGCQNPWDLTRNAGGSSGGSGAALAASMVLAATGGDTSGSIRNPASTCGVVGFKPTFGLVSRYGVVPISWTLDHLGPLANTVEDTAILLKAIAGHDPKDRFSARTSVPDYPRLLGRSIKGMRIGVMAPSEITGFHADTRTAFGAAVDVLMQLGAELREIVFPERMKTAGRAQQIIRICEAAAYHRRFLLAAADRYRSDAGQPRAATARVRTDVEAGSLLTAAQYMQAQRARTLFIEDTRRVYESIDVFVSPTMPAPAGVPIAPAETFRNWWNLSGFPAVSVPCGFSSDPAGLPIGLQISGRPFDDARVLAVAHAYEAATTWHRRRPAL